ncbi:MAG: hypothetical protein K8T26_02875 [Lentisphaerae bacterium]|nr:hypothetical protein [Lentisphaerota bacterium]
MVDHSFLKRLAVLAFVLGGVSLARAQTAAGDWPFDNAGAAPAEQPADSGAASQDVTTAPPGADWASAGTDTAPATPESGATADGWSLQENEQDLSLMQSGPGDGPSTEPGGEPMMDEPDDGGTRLGGAAEQVPSSRQGIKVAAYEELLRDNVSLRREIADMEQRAQDSLADKQRLENELRDMERQVSDSVAVIQQLRQGGAGGGEASADTAALAQVRAEKETLAAEVEALRMQLAATPATGGAGSGEAPQPGSDLYRALEQENASLKQQLQASALTVSNDAVQRESKLKSELDQANAENAKLQGTIDKLVQRVPAMEKELAALRDSVGIKDRDLVTKDRDLESLRLEMEKREQRLIKAERMNALMEKTREEVKQVSKKEQRDLYYNMAAVYSKEARYQDAEQAYLSALRVDPTDAGSHYNLGILYEDVLGDKRKAVMHYRAYLKLAPSADDVDEVKSWIMQLEIN